MELNVAITEVRKLTRQHEGLTKIQEALETLQRADQLLDERKRALDKINGEIVTQEGRVKSLTDKANKVKSEALAQADAQRKQLATSFATQQASNNSQLQKLNGQIVKAQDTLATLEKKHKEVVASHVKEVQDLEAKLQGLRRQSEQMKSAVAGLAS